MNLKKDIFAKILVGILLIMALLAVTGTKGVAESILGIGFETFGIAFILALFVVFVNGAALFSLIEPFSEIKFTEFIHAFLASWVMSYITPGKIGGVTITAMLKDKLKPGQTAAAFVADKGITVVAAFSVSLLVLNDLLSAEEMTLLLGGLIVVCLIGAALLLHSSGRALIKKALGKRSKFFEGYHKSFVEIVKQPIPIVMNALMTMFRFFVQGMLLTVLFSALGIQTGILQMMLLVAMGALMAFAPFTFSGLGVKESVFVVLATRMGLPPAESAAVALASTAISWLTLALFIGIFYKETKKLKLDN